MRLLSVYGTWQRLLPHVPKLVRYSLCIRIDLLICEVIERTSEAQFSALSERHRIIRTAITKNDTLKFMLYVLYEMEGIPESSYLLLATEFEEIGRMLYGWVQNTASQEEKKPHPALSK
jgi:hypothetical protein